MQAAAGCSQACCSVHSPAVAPRSSSVRTQTQRSPVCVRSSLLVAHAASNGKQQDSRGSASPDAQLPPQQPQQPQRRVVRRQRKPSSAPQLLQQRQAQEQAGDYDQQQQQPQPQQAWVPQPQQRQRQRPGGDGEQGWFREQQPLGQWAQQQEGYVGPQALAQQQLQQWQGIGADSYDDGLLPVSYAPSPAWAAARDAAAAAAAAGGAGGGSSALLGGPYMQQQLQQQQRQPWPDTVFVSEQWGAEARQRRLAAWFKQPQFGDALALHAAIVERSSRGQLEVEAVQHLIRRARSPRDAALALSAVSAVRQVALARGRVAPWDDATAKAFVKMTVACDCHEVLVSAMQRPNELGLVFKHKALNVALKHWGEALALHKLEQICEVVPGAGLRPNAALAYAIVRAAVNARDWERLDAALAWFAARGVSEFRPAMHKLLATAAAQRAAGAAASAGAPAQGEQEAAAGADAAGAAGAWEVQAQQVPPCAGASPSRDGR